MAINPQITVDVTPSIATTTNGTSTVTILSSPFHYTTGGQMITFDVVGYDFDNNEVATAKVAVKVKNVSGTLSMVGTPIHLVPIAVGSSPGLSTASLNVVISGSNINLNVIGVTDRTIKWVAYKNAAIEVLSTWTAVPTPQDGYIQIWSATNTRWEPKDFGSGIPSTGASNGYVLTWVAANNRWEPQPTGTLVPVGGDLTGTLGAAYIGSIGGASNAGGTITVKPTQFTMDRNLSISTTGTYAGTANSFIVKQDGYEVLNTCASGQAWSFRINTAEGDYHNGKDFYINAGNSVRIIAGARGSDATNWLQSAYTILGTKNINGIEIDLSSGTANGSTVTINPATIILPNITTSGSASSGAATLPGNPVGFISVTIGGTVRKIPYYA